ncbi:Ceramide-1-phosphate transfer protein [Exaiptasia diaphana]|nr:Ceramide-1-phosphate transfer protein [Exaiptasia diaphana]
MTERKFRLDVVVDSFTKAKQEDGSIVLDEYVRGYDELCLSEASDKDDSSKLAADAYNETLARYHPWLIRKAALLAMYTLDNVGDMIKKASGGNANEEEAKKLLKEGVDAIQPVYDATEALYTSYDLHGLP